MDDKDKKSEENTQNSENSNNEESEKKKPDMQKDLNNSENQKENISKKLISNDDLDNFDFDKYLHIDDEESKKVNKDSIFTSNDLNDSEDIENINSKKTKWQKFEDFWKRKDNTGKKILVIVLAIILILVIGVGGYFLSRLSLLETNDDEQPVTTPEDVIYDELDFAMMDGVTDAQTLNELLKKWATNNGEIMSSRNVINVLLLGLDSKSNLSDSMILLSLNKKTKKINIISFYRDSYIYIAPPSYKPCFHKLNFAYKRGGAKGVVDTIEKNYKIKIDEYASVDYNSFPKVINSLGGVKINLKPHEAKYLNEKCHLNLKTGNNTLNGKEALWYSRIRYSDKDGDVSRTNRQRKVITSIINSAKNASIYQLDNMIKTLFPNVKTSMTRTQIVSYATQALSNDWLQFDIVQQEMPTKDTRRGATVKNCGWVWIADYPGAAQQLQNILYGRTNIKLDNDRISAIDLKPTTTKSRRYNVQRTTQPRKTTARSRTRVITEQAKEQTNTTTTTTKSITRQTVTTKPVVESDEKVVE